MRAALAAAAIMLVLSSRAGAEPLKLLGGHLTGTVPAGWEVQPKLGSGGAVGQGTTFMMINLVLGTRDDIVALVEQAEPDTMVYGDTHATRFAGVDVLAMTGKSKSGKGGGRQVYISSTCLGTITIMASWEDGTDKATLAKLARLMGSLALTTAPPNLFPTDEQGTSGYPKPPRGSPPTTSRSRSAPTGQPTSWDSRPRTCRSTAARPTART
jgi:hypothetical protein